MHDGFLAFAVKDPQSPIVSSTLAITYVAGAQTSFQRELKARSVGHFNWCVTFAAANCVIHKRVFARPKTVRD